MSQLANKNPSPGAKITALIHLTRLNRPIGIYLVMWPTLWSLWLAAKGAPDVKNLIIFITGCVFMRSAGCIINDYADRHLDGHVRRTQHRPLVSGLVTSIEALTLFAVLGFASFILVLFTNALTIKLSIAAMGLAVVYPFVKRYSKIPQVVLGCAFACSIPMAFAAQMNSLPISLWLIYIAVVLWTVAYDTFYAMVDRDDDLKAGIKSTAILFGELDRPMTASLQVFTLITLVLAGTHMQLSWIYYVSLVGAGCLFGYQQWLIRDREREACFKAFLNNNWVGMLIFIGIVTHYAVYPDAS